MNPERGEHSDSRYGDNGGQLRRPTSPAEYAVAGDDVRETGNEIEPENERNNVAGGGSIGGVAE